AGIAVSPPRKLSDLPERLIAMQKAMRHRGPDDAGIYVSPDGCVGLVNCRLAIRDVSPNGRMPMANGDQTVWITYNGEIYNADELRPLLERMGYKFRSHSDTEVILHGYQAWREQVVERLRGMFAFAILDSRSGRRLLLARDRLGIKPLYYAKVGGTFLFASELKALHASGLLSREISPVGLVGYLMFGSVPNPWTIYADTLALPPASLLVWQDGNTEVRSYWELPVDSVQSVTHEEAVEQVRFYLKDAVRSHLVSDVPVGAFLSGGLDSSAVVAMMRNVTNGPIRTCSVIFEEKEYNEAQYARAMAERVGAEHYERLITPKDLWEELDNLLGSMDQPTIDGVNTYFVSKIAREAGLTVALSGLGGDELFGGYPNTFGRIPRLERALRLIHRVPMASLLAQKTIVWCGMDNRWRKVTDALGRPVSLASAYLVCRGLFSPREVRALVVPEIWREATAGFDPVQYIMEKADGSAYVLQWISRAELGVYTHNQLLRDTDVMSMAHSLEVRVPLLDHRLVEVVLRLPESVQNVGGRPKALLIDALVDELPSLIREPNRKMGFSFPFPIWLKRDLGGTLTEGLIKMTEVLRRLINVDSYRRFQEINRHHWSRIWAIFVLGRYIIDNNLHL
ncbi:MAG: asparagine synthase (glutamine-hydrolyzing), partial [Candidatus Methanomethyliaceae archaeon]